MPHAYTDASKKRGKWARYKKKAKHEAQKEALNKKDYSVYLVFIGGILTYVGITRQTVQNRMHGHFGEKPHFREALKSNQLLVRKFRDEISETEACRLEKMILGKFTFYLQF